jgi:hypothetical protein
MKFSPRIARHASDCLGNSNGRDKLKHLYKHHSSRYPIPLHCFNTHSQTGDCQMTAVANLTEVQTFYKVADIQF